MKPWLCFTAAIAAVAFSLATSLAPASALADDDGVKRDDDREFTRTEAKSFDRVAPTRSMRRYSRDKDDDDDDLGGVAGARPRGDDGEGGVSGDVAKRPQP